MDKKHSKYNHTILYGYQMLSFVRLVTDSKSLMVERLNTMNTTKIYVYIVNHSYQAEIFI